MLWGFFGFSLSKPAAFSGQHEYNQVSGNPERKHQVGCEEAETWASLDLPTGYDPKHTSRSTKASFQKKSWKILEWPSLSPHLNPKENLRWDLTEVVTAQEPKNLQVTELVATAHQEWAKIPQGYCTACGRLCIMFAAGNNSKRLLCLVLKKLATKGLNNVEIAVVIKSDICVQYGESVVNTSWVTLFNCSCFILWGLECNCKLN